MSNMQPSSMKKEKVKEEAVVLKIDDSAGAMHNSSSSSSAKLCKQCSSLSDELQKETVTAEYRDNDDDNHGSKSTSTSPELKRKSNGNFSFSKPKSRFVQQDSGLLQQRSSDEDYNAITYPTPAISSNADDIKLPKKKDHASILHCSFMRKRWMLLQCLLLGILTSLAICAVSMKRVRQRRLWGLQAWKWGLMIWVIFSGRFVSSRFLELLVYFVKTNMYLKKKLLFFAEKLRCSVRNCLWLSLVLAGWLLLIYPEIEHSTTSSKVYGIITRALISLLLGSFLWLLKTLAMKLLISTFYINTFFDRILDSIFNHKVLETLSGNSLIDTVDTNASEKRQLRCCGWGRSRIMQKRREGDHSCHYSTEQLRSMNAKDISAWTMMQLENFVRVTNLTFFSSKDNPSKQIADQESDTEEAAKTIFGNVAKPESKVIEKEDLKKYLIDKDAEEIFAKLQQSSEKGEITTSAVKNWVVNTYLERKSLKLALTDTKTAVKQLNQFVSSLLFVILFIVILLVLEVVTKDNILLVSSQLVVAAFVFKNTAKTVFEAIIFVFVLHPFDVGDRCIVDGVQMIVEEMNILSTIFLRYDNEKIYYPNSVLVTKPISNFQRSPPMGDSIDFNIDVSTPRKKIDELKMGMAKYLEDKRHHWSLKHTLAVKEIVNMNSIRMTLYVTHTINHQNIIEKINRKTDLVLELKGLFEKLEITYHLLPQEVNVKFVDSSRNQQDMVPL